MKPIPKTFWIVWIIFIVISSNSNAQNYESDGVSKDKLLSAAREIMVSAGNCALITVDENIVPQVRAMDPFLPENDFTVWFGTNAKSRKVKQIKTNPRVTLYYFDSDASGYVIIHGKAQLVNDQYEKEKHWKAEWEAFYPNKTEAYLLIKVTPESMEVLSPPRGIAGDPVTWQPPVVHFDQVK